MKQPFARLSKAALLTAAAALAVGSVTPSAHAAVQRGQLPCKGGTLNYSFEPGILTTTVYYSSHCSRTEGMYMGGYNGKDHWMIGCLKVPAGAKGKKKVDGKVHDINLTVNGYC